jgi:DNA-binding transcriptional LysR family regulator
VALFERVRQRLVLTPAGKRYEAAIKPLMAQIESATLELIASGQGGGALRLSTLPTFGAKWLIPRLPRFSALHPRIDLQFVPYLQGYDLKASDLDCSILYGNGYWPGAVAQYLVGREMVLIAPVAARTSERISRHADIRRMTLLHHVSVPNSWALWCEARGLKSVNGYRGPHLDQYQSLIRAVQAGMGLALVPLCLVLDDIAAGFVKTPFTETLTHEMGYWLCCPENKASLPTLDAFREWLRSETDPLEVISPANPVKPSELSQRRR